MVKLFKQSLELTPEEASIICSPASQAESELQSEGTANLYGILRGLSGEERRGGDSRSLQQKAYELFNRLIPQVLPPRAPKSSRKYAEYERTVYGLERRRSYLSRAAEIFADEYSPQDAEQRITELARVMTGADSYSAPIIFAPIIARGLRRIGQPISDSLINQAELRASAWTKTLLQREAGVSKDGEETPEVKATPEERKRQFVEWAIKHGRDVEWVEKTFQFQDDGSVIVPGDFVMKSLRRPDASESRPFEDNYYYLTDLPAGITEVQGNFIAPSLKMADMTNFPAHVRGNVDIRWATRLRTLKGMEGCTIDGDIDLSNTVYLDRVEFPEGIELQGRIIMGLKYAGSDGRRAEDHAREAGYFVVDTDEYLKSQGR